MRHSAACGSSRAWRIHTHLSPGILRLFVLPRTEALKGFGGLHGDGKLEDILLFGPKCEIRRTRFFFFSFFCFWAIRYSKIVYQNGSLIRFLLNLVCHLSNYRSFRFDTPPLLRVEHGTSNGSKLGLYSQSLGFNIHPIEDPIRYRFHPPVQ